MVQDIGSLILGEKIKDNLFSRGNFTRHQARLALDSINHPEIRQAIDSLEAQMEIGNQTASFYSRNSERFRNPVLFSGGYKTMAKSIVQNLMQVAHPDYHP